MACRHFGLIKAAPASNKARKVSEEHPLTLTDPDILRAQREQDLDFPASFRITEKGGELFCIGSDLSTLRILLNTAREQFSKSGRLKGAAEVSLKESVSQYKSCAAMCSASMC